MQPLSERKAPPIVKSDKENLLNKKIVSKCRHDNKCYAGIQKAVGRGTSSTSLYPWCHAHVLYKNG